MELHTPVSWKFWSMSFREGRISTMIFFQRTYKCEKGRKLYFIQLYRNLTCFFMIISRGWTKCCFIRLKRQIILGWMCTYKAQSTIKSRLHASLLLKFTIKVTTKIKLNDQHSVIFIIQYIYNINSARIGIPMSMLTRDSSWGYIKNQK